VILQFLEIRIASDSLYIEAIQWASGVESETKRC
jgi:hypothetical protein